LRVPNQGSQSFRGEFFRDVHAVNILPWQPRVNATPYQERAPVRLRLLGHFPA
jgi:hypothetical protein